MYLAVACAGAAVGVVFFFAKLPEVEEQAVRRGSIITEETLEVVSLEWQYRVEKALTFEGCRSIRQCHR